MYLFLHRSWVRTSDQHQKDGETTRNEKPFMSTEKFLFGQGQGGEEENAPQSTLLLVYSEAYKLLLNLPLGSFVQANQYYIWLQICRQFREG